MEESWTKKVALANAAAINGTAGMERLVKTHMGNVKWDLILAMNEARVSAQQLASANQAHGAILVPIPMFAV